MRIVGVDPGLANLGLGAVESAGPRVRFLGCEVVRTRADREEGERLSAVFEATTAFLAAHAPVAVAIEDQFFGRQRQASSKVAQALGVVRLAAHRLGVPAFGYGPSQVKQALVGSGRADKDQVAYMVRALLGLATAPGDSHVSDALALALTHWSAHRVSVVAAAERGAAAASSASGRGSGAPTRWAPRRPRR